MSKLKRMHSGSRIRFDGMVPRISIIHYYRKSVIKNISRTTVKYKPHSYMYGYIWFYVSFIRY